MKKQIIIDSEESAEVKKVERNIHKDNYKLILNSNIIEWLIYMIGYTLVLLVVSNIFINFEIKNFLYGFLGAIIISILNKVLKPFLKVLTLPITILSWGLFYELTNVILLYITMLILGKENFYIHGIISPLIIAFSISTLNIIVEKLLIIPITEKSKNK